MTSSIVDTREGMGGTKTVIETNDSEVTSDMRRRVTCMFCDDFSFDVKDRSAYSQHLREEHKVTKNIDILIQFIIEQEKGNKQGTSLYFLYIRLETSESFVVRDCNTQLGFMIYF